MIPDTPREKLYWFIDELRAGRMSLKDFCDAFETTFNLDLDKRELSEHERIAFGGLFDKVVWYSPFPEERARIPNYLDERTILDAVETALRLLRG